MVDYYFVGVNYFTLTINSLLFAIHLFLYIIKH